MGLVPNTPLLATRNALSNLGAATMAEAVALHAATRELHNRFTTEPFNLRQPEHIVLAGELGLGVFDQQKIWYRLVQS